MLIESISDLGPLDIKTSHLLSPHILDSKHTITLYVSLAFKPKLAIKTTFVGKGGLISVTSLYLCFVSKHCDYLYLLSYV